ncbi:MAG TPA: hypothetical protein VD866_07865 [Urbifossiella sp.]|nr:hypothetical protein [Urbifossiella sp.]
MTLPKRFVAAALTLLVACGLVHASGAGFRISAAGIDLGKVENEGAEIPRYRVKVKVGETVTLVADGWVQPRGGQPARGDIDAGAWLFDDEAFKVVPPEKAKSDKTKMVVALTSLKAGTSRVRFVGDILGRYQKYDVMVEVVGK